MKQEFTISLFSESHIGILSRITLILSRRQINIESITASESAVPGVQMLTMVVRTTPEMVQKVARQVEKVVDVLKVFVHTSSEIICQEMALYKVTTRGLMSGSMISDIVRKHNARILEVKSEYMVVEKSGTRAEIKELLALLEPCGVLQFVSSGRVAVTRQVKELNAYLREMEEARGTRQEALEFYN
ncbi:MAG TPA: acetolactate synthase small subunit [Bacteroidales bacterium]|jgi:acetolactate synthase-1/3 small subunit|nr:acetolactate synthase small subunit [Bacteroidales bacterium]HNX83806.1 acetolactate synthase small subunit [Bacteroidales bacterium]HOC48406.1 acetolactate synthase small subunit [Bacteroidales bacterium]HPS97891.1 acetolactate synthase small subunit [Bacteroidales bacterium]